jgi:hypothetical protein
MSPFEIIVAVLYLRKTDFAGITKLGTRILNKGIYVETTLYATPVVSKTEFEKQLQAAIDAVALADKGGSKADRKKQIDLFFKMLRKLVNYVNGLYEDMPVELEKSGFDTNAIPTPHALPDQPIIKKIIKGNEPGTIIIKLAPFTGLDKNKRERRTFIVLVFADAVTQEFDTVFTGTNSRKIVVENVPLMTTLYYTVIIRNAAGPSELASKIKYTLTD